MRRWLSYYHPKLPLYLAYMLQQVEYRPGKFLGWILRGPDLTRVMRRQKLVFTLKAKLLITIITAFYLFYILMAIWYLTFSPLLAIVTVLIIPYPLILLTYLIVLAAWLYYEEPRRNHLLKKATKIFQKHPGLTIAIAGSYGKTTMKELLMTVLSEGREVVATPGNRNVPVSHATWAKKLSGQEDILLVEYGEGAPGDIAKLAKLTNPDYGVITGLAPNHLDEYKSLEAVARDLLSLSDFVDGQKLFINSESAELETYSPSGLETYSRHKVMGWKVKQLAIGYDGISFVMHKEQRRIKVRSGLLGRHQVGPLAYAAALAYRLGLSISQIETGLSKTQSFEHRMQPRHQQGAWIIDDTYNGSLEGFRAGLQLLTDLPAKRKIYVTPGLVDQGSETKRVHLEIGELIAAAKPDRVVLMQNSVTQHIIKGLEAGKYQGNLHIEADPLTFYTNLEHQLAAGDLFVLQNDWTDNYN